MQTFLLCPLPNATFQSVVWHHLLTSELLLSYRACVVYLQPALYVGRLIALACLCEHDWVDHNLSADGAHVPMGDGGCCF